MSYLSVQNIPTENSPDIVWISWYKDLRKSLGSKKANDIFSRAWSAQNASDSNANTTILREEMSKNGVEISGGFVGDAVDFSNQAKGYIGDILTYGKWAYIGLGTIVFISIGAFVWQLATKPSVRKEAVDLGSNIGATVATRGMNKI